MWLEEMQPLLAAWLVRGLRNEKPSCRHAACMASADLMPYLGEYSREVRTEVLTQIDLLFSRIATDDMESQMIALRTKGRLR